MKKVLFIVLVLAALSVVAVGPAQAQDMGCSHDMATIASLRECVVHAYLMGHIDNAGVEASLLAKINAAQAAYDRGDTATAVRLLEAFISQVEAQGGVHIMPPHDQHLIEHAQMVIATLGG